MNNRKNQNKLNEINKKNSKIRVTQYVKEVRYFAPRKMRQIFRIEEFFQIRMI